MTKNTDALEAALAELESVRSEYQAWLADNEIDPENPDPEFVSQISEHQLAVAEAGNAVAAAIRAHLRS